VTPLGFCGNVNEIPPSDPSASAATIARMRCKSIQDNPRKTKQKALHCLGFPWWKWAFSMGYSESK
jgi:hypothetical protein